MRAILASLFLLTILATTAQVGVGIIVEPTLNLANIGSEPQSTSDSFNSLKKQDYTLSIGFEFRKYLNKYKYISFIPGYHQTNMLHVKENLQFLDVVHPELTEIRDFSQAATKNAYLRYRQKYVGTQILYGAQIQRTRLPNKMEIEVGGGIGAYFLLANDVRIRTEGFALDEEYIHVINTNVGIVGRSFLPQLIGFSDIVYELTPKARVSAGLKLNIPLQTSTTSDPSVYILPIAIRIGLRQVF